MAVVICYFFLFYQTYTALFAGNLIACQPIDPEIHHRLQFAICFVYTEWDKCVGLGCGYKAFIIRTDELDTYVQ